MTEDAMFTHAATAYVRDDLERVISREAHQVRDYVSAQLEDESGSRQFALEQSEAFWSWLVIAIELREHMNAEPCDGTERAECRTHRLCAELSAAGVIGWTPDPLGPAEIEGSHPSDDPFFSDSDNHA